jgi:hypothetical protein
MHGVHNPHMLRVFWVRELHSFGLHSPRMTNETSHTALSTSVLRLGST